MENKVYPEIKNCILLCLLFLGIQVGLGIIIGALFFGIIHLNPWQFLSAFIIGLFAAWVSVNSNSILLCIYIHLFNNVLYTITEKFKNFIPIKGFNIMNETTVEFQPLWFDLTGLAIFALGIVMLKIGFRKTKTS